MTPTRYYTASTASTNTFLHEMMRQDKLPEGFLLYTDFQTAGKGQPGNTWESENGKNLLFSMLLYPHSIKVYEQFILSEITGLAIRKVLEKYTDDICIKWPNDIYWKDKKIAGILIENSLFRDRIDTCIIGIGLNVNQEVFISNAPNPVSLRQITGNDVNREILLKEIQAELLNIYQNYSPEFIHQEYLNHLYRRNGFHRYAETAANTVFDAEIEDVLPDGRLILRTQAGEIRTFYFKEIQFVL